MTRCLNQFLIWCKDNRFFGIVAWLLRKVGKMQTTIRGIESEEGWIDKKPVDLLRKIVGMHGKAVGIT